MYAGSYTNIKNYSNFEWTQDSDPKCRSKEFARFCLVESRKHLPHMKHSSWQGRVAYHGELFCDKIFSHTKSWITNSKTKISNDTDIKNAIICGIQNSKGKKIKTIYHFGSEQKFQVNF